MLVIDRTAEAHVVATPARCREVLTGVGAYASWSSLIERVAPSEEDGVLLVTGRLFAVRLEMRCVLEAGPEEIVLRRVPFDAQDDERYVARWTVTPCGEDADVHVHVEARLDAPGPASLLQGRVARRLTDELLADFVRAV
jgi:hypothetical protein